MKILSEQVPNIPHERIDYALGKNVILGKSKVFLTKKVIILEPVQVLDSN